VEYVFLREAYGDLPAFLFGWSSVMLIASGGLAAVSTALASFLASFVHSARLYHSRLSRPGQVVHWRLGIQQIVAVAVILLFSWVNARGIQIGSRVQWVRRSPSWGDSDHRTRRVPPLAHGIVAAFEDPRHGDNRAGGVSAFGAAMLAARGLIRDGRTFNGSGEIENRRGTSHAPDLRDADRDSRLSGTNLAYFYALPFSEVMNGQLDAYRMRFPLRPRRRRHSRRTERRSCRLRS